MAQKFSLRLQQLLVSRGMSISQLSRITGISRQAIYKWRTDDNISAASLHKLASALNVSEEWLRYGIKSNSDRKFDIVTSKNAFIRVVDNHAFSDTKLHLNQHDVLVGAYHFENGKITCYNTSSVLNPNSAELNNINDLAKHICPNQLKRVKLAALKLLKHYHVADLYLATPHNTNIYQCTLMPIFSSSHLLEGISFSVKVALLNHDILAKQLKAKCAQCLLEFAQGKVS